MKLKFQLPTWLLLLLVFIGASAFTGSELDNIAVKYSKTILAEDLSKHLHVLAGDEYEGRETGEEGQKKAAQYIAAHFESLGMKPLFGDSYYQEFPLELMDPNGIEIQCNGKEYGFLKDFYYFPGFKDQKIETDEILFLGYGIDDPKYSDYEGVDVTGKVLLILDQEPVSKNGISYITNSKKKSRWTTSYQKKLKLAEKKGAKALFIIVDKLNERMDRVGMYISKPSLRLKKDDSIDVENDEREMIPNFYIGESMARDLFAANEIKFKKLKKTALRGKPQQKALSGSYLIDVRREGKKVSSENVLGYLEGTDKKDELVVITAHYDHVGRDGDKIFNGADDDGSGTVAVLELAQAFADAKKNGNGPRRSVLFMTVSGEEKGLLGSQYYVENPVFPLESTVCDLNIDMIGRLDEKHEDNPDYVYLIGSDKLSTELHDLSENANQLYTQLELDYTFNSDSDPNRFYYRSDHYNFAKNGIPVIFYFNGTHEDYHKETDTVEKINFAKMEKITRLIFFTAWEIANREDRLVVDKE